MSPFRSRFPALLTASVLTALCSVPAQARADDDPDAYPTDVCVDHKLRAAANYCREAVWAWDRGDPSQFVDARLRQGARATRAGGRRRSERSLEAGVSRGDHGDLRRDDQRARRWRRGSRGRDRDLRGVAQGHGGGYGHGHGDNAERKCESRATCLPHRRVTTCSRRIRRTSAIATATAIAASSSGAAPW
jgi:hypothetical protein